MTPEPVYDVTGSGLVQWPGTSGARAALTAGHLIQKPVEASMDDRDDTAPVMVARRRCA